MKFNLNNYLICNNDYLNYFIKKYNFKEEEYTYFTSTNLKSTNLNNILLPYLFSLSKITESEYEYFKMFYFNYLEKSDLHIDFPYDDSNSLIEYIQKDIILTITFIIAAQYYFL